MSKTGSATQEVDWRSIGEDSEPRLPFPREVTHK